MKISATPTIRIATRNPVSDFEEFNFFSIFPGKSRVDASVEAKNQHKCKLTSGLSQPSESAKTFYKKLPLRFILICENGHNIFGIDIMNMIY